MSEFFEEGLPVFVDDGLCSQCGGRCCRLGSGSVWPEQCGKPDEAVMREEVTALLRTGKYRIDVFPDDVRWLVKDPYYRENIPYNENEPPAERSYYLRPSMEGAGDGIFSVGSGRCVFHTDAGCTLQHDERPITCRALEPIGGDEPGDNCTMEDFWRELYCAAAWYPYASILREAGEMVEHERTVHGEEGLPGHQARLQPTRRAER